MYSKRQSDLGLRIIIKKGELMKIHHGDTENTEVFEKHCCQASYLYGFLRAVCDSVVNSYDLASEPSDIICKLYDLEC